MEGCAVLEEVGEGVCRMSGRPRVWVEGRGDVDGKDRGSVGSWREGRD